MAFKCLIIEDDQFSLSLLKDRLETDYPTFALQIAKTAREGITAIRSFQPDLVFLDIELPDMSGFEMLKKLGSWDTFDFKIIFVSVFKEYVIRAIRLRALDYIIKPIQEEELQAAVDRFIKLYPQPGSHPYLEDRMQTHELSGRSKETIHLQLQEGLLAVALEEVLFIQGERNYSHIHYDNQSKKLISKNLGEFEELLKTKGFYRIHKSYLINGRSIEARNGRYRLIMKDGSTLPISRRRVSDFENWLGQYRSDLVNA
ncbi:MAG: LytTR family DNA-binding domain-containing protein [Bacteroidota bacterium]